jgi:signal transduction histidine kinase
MTVQALSFLLAAIISAALSIAILMRGSKNRLYAGFSILNGVLFLYYLSSFIYGVSDHGLWLRISVLAALAIPASAIRFFTVFLGQTEGPGHKAMRWSVTLAVLLAPFALSGWVNKYAIKLVTFVFVFASLCFCMGMIWTRLRATTSRVESARLKYLLFGGLVAVAFSLSDYLPRVDVPWFPTLGNMITVIYMYFLSQVIIQFRLLDLNELVGKMLVLATLVTLLATVYTLIGLFVSDIPGLVFFNTFIAGFVILILFEPVNRFVEDRVNRLLFRERYEFGRQLALLRRELANVIDVDQMCQLLLTRLENSRRVTGASVYLLNEEAGRLRCLGYIGPPPINAFDPVTERPYLDKLREATALVHEAVEGEIREALALGDETSMAHADAGRETQRMLSSLEADVSLAMISEDRIIGVLNVRDDRVRESYSPEEIANLVAIANQAAICVENSRIVKTIRDRDRLAAVGEMAAGLAHEVRNPLGAIKGAAQMLAEFDDPGGEADREFLDIIIEEVNRLNKVVSAFLDYAKPYGGTAGPVKVNAIIERVTTLLRGTAKDVGVMLELDLEPNLRPARIDPEVLRQVLWNLGLNALEAMETDESGTLTIRTQSSSRVEPTHRGHFGHEAIGIVFADTGPGIPATELESIFIPFFTTKEKGTGLGLAICQRLIRAAGGNIGVSSTEGNGATFTVTLPLWDETTASAERKLRTE